LAERGTEGERVAYGGVHRSSSVQVPRLLGPTAALLGSDRTGRTVGSTDRRTPRRAAVVFVPGHGRAPRREVADRWRHVVAARPALVGVPEQEGRSGPTSLRGQARHRRPVDLQYLPA